MFSALLYLQFQTLKNRLLERLRRLRRPRYLFGALAGGFYLVMVFARPFFSMRQSFGEVHRLSPGYLPEVPGSVWEFAAAFALALLTALAWLVPHERAALVFTEAEIAFLFPAPIRRRTLIHYKLVRSQLAVLFTVFFLTLFTRWSGGLGGALMRAAGWWILLVHHQPAPARRIVRADPAFGTRRLDVAAARDSARDFPVGPRSRRGVVGTRQGALARPGKHRKLRGGHALPANGRRLRPGALAAAAVPGRRAAVFGVVGDGGVLGGGGAGAACCWRCIICGWCARTWRSRKPASRPRSVMLCAWRRCVRATGKTPARPANAARPSASRRPGRPPWRSCGKTCSGRVSFSTSDWPSPPSSGRASRALPSARPAGAKPRGRRWPA